MRAICKEQFIPVSMLVLVHLIFFLLKYRLHFKSLNGGKLASMKNFNILLYTQYGSLWFEREKRLFQTLQL